MVDEKCDYCKLYDEKYLCLAESKMRKFDEFAWAEDYPDCDSNFYLGCPCYLYEIKPEVKKNRLEDNQEKFDFLEDFL